MPAHFMRLDDGREPLPSRLAEHSQLPQATGQFLHPKYDMHLFARNTLLLADGESPNDDLAIMSHHPKPRLGQFLHALQGLERCADRHLCPLAITPIGEETVAHELVD